MKARFWYSNKKNRYSIFRGLTGQYQDQILKSGYAILQARKVLSKAWIGYKIAKNKGEHERMKNHASVIQKLNRITRCQNCKSTISISTHRYR
jgi:hypothetical protein